MKQHHALAASLVLVACSASALVDETDAPASGQPARFAPEALGQSGRITFTPAISPDGQTLYFTQADCKRIWDCPQELFTAKREGNGWASPQKVGFSAGERVEWPSFAPDGKQLLFSWATKRARHSGKEVYEDFDLYSLDLGEHEAAPRPLDSPDINRLRAGRVKKLRFVNNETAPSLTAAGDLYFWTQRLDGVGNRDIYVAPAAPGGGFERARALPAPINSSGNDAGVWVHPDGNLMLVNYEDRGGEGGTDIFVSRRRAGGWSEPVNLGPQINSRHSDFAARITPDGKTVLFTSDRPVGNAAPGLFQVWEVPVEAIPPLRDMLAKGD